MKSTTSAIVILATLITSTTAQDVPISLYEEAFGTSYKDICCASGLLSHGPTSTCAEPVTVGNVTDCTTDLYLTGCGCCVEKVSVVSFLLSVIILLLPYNHLCL
jgi:hypothetical protein